MTEELRAEQQFLLASLRDLEREREAGDIDTADYNTLRDGYIARAAAITREINGDGIAPCMPIARWKRAVAVSLAVVLSGVGAGIFVAQQSGQRLPGESLSGGIEQSSVTMLATARQLNFSDPQKAIELYTNVLQIEPDNTEALTYRSWILALTARNSTGSVKQLALLTAVTDLLRAQKEDPEYPDAHCFLGIIYFRFLDNPVLSQPQLKVCKAKNPPASVTSFVDAISKEVEAAVSR